MATVAPEITQANLTPGGGVFVPRLSKKPVYAFRDLSSFQPQPVALYRSSSSAGRKPRKHILFGAFFNPKLRVLKPIPVDVSQRNRNYVAQFKEAREFGYGASMSLALDDLGKTLSELYVGLNDRYDSLGPDLKNLHEKLSRYLALRQK